MVHGRSMTMFHEGEAPHDVYVYYRPRAGLFTCNRKFCTAQLVVITLSQFFSKHILGVFCITTIFFCVDNKPGWLYYRYENKNAYIQPGSENGKLDLACVTDIYQGIGKRKNVFKVWCFR